MMIRPLLPEEAEAYVRLRREALEDTPPAFSSSPSDDRARDPQFIRSLLASETQTIFGAFVPELVGIVGIARDSHVKSSHRAHLWGLYVKPSHRRLSFGASLVRAAVDFARSLDGVSHVQLSVSERTSGARALYEANGFVAWGVEPEAMCIDGEKFAEIHMALKLTEGGGLKP